MLLALFVTGLLATVAQAGDAGTKSVLSVPSLLRAFVAPVHKAGVVGSHENPSDSVPNQQQQVVPQLEANVVLHQEVPQTHVPVGPQVYYGAPQYSPLPVVPNGRFVQVVPYLNSVPSQVQPQQVAIEVDAVPTPVQFLYGSVSGPLFVRPVHFVSNVQAVHHPQVFQTFHSQPKPVVQGEVVHTSTVAKVEGSNVPVDTTGDVHGVQVLSSTSQVSSLKTNQATEQKSQSVDHF